MKANEILQKMNELSFEDQKRANMYHITADVAVIGMNNMELEDKLYNMLSEDDIEVQYINAQRTDFKESIINEDMSNQQLYDIVSSTGQQLARKVNHVLDRLKYRLLDNVSYTGNEARKLSFNIDNKLTQCINLLDDCYSEIG